MNVLLVGAGTIGTVVAKDLILSGCRSLTVVDLDRRRLDELQMEHSRVQACELDVTDEASLSRAMKDADVVVNAASYRFNLHVLRAAMAAKCNLVDLGGLYHMTLEELRYDTKAKRAGISVLLGMGDDPGTSNVMARMASWELDSVSEISIRWGSSSVGSADVAFGFSIATCLDEASKKAMKFSNGKIIEVPPLSEMEEVTFPHPVGKQQTYAILHSELATLPRSIEGVREVSYKDSWDQATINVVRFLLSSGFASDATIDLDGREVSPPKVLLTHLSPNEPETSVGCLLVTGRGKRKGRAAETTLCLGPIRYSRRYRAPSVAFSTAIPASIAAQMISKGLITQRGVFPSEAFSRDQVNHFLGEMKARGLVIRKLSARSSPG